MPERKKFRGREVKHAHRIIVNGKELIRITFLGRKGQPGRQMDVTTEEYEAGLVRTFKVRASKL